MKAAGKNSAKLQAVAKSAPVTESEQRNSQETIDASSLIGYDAQETVSMVADVLDFLVDYHLREAHCETTPNVERGMIYVIEYARDALRLQERELDPALNREAANG